MTIEKIKEYIEKSFLSKDDKEFWNNHIGFLNAEQLDFLLEEFDKNPNSLIKFNGDLQLKRDILTSGSGEEWEETIEKDANKIKLEHSK